MAVRDPRSPAEDARASARAFRGAFALIVSTTACAIVVLAAPRPVLPSQLPALRLDRAELSRQQAQDLALAAKTPRGADVDALIRVFREDGLIERDPAAGEGARDDHRRALAELARPLFGRLDADAARALRLSLSERALAALHGELSDLDEARGLLGRFPELLARYGYVDGQGRWLAPELAARALYVARFNLLCGRPLREGLTKLEQRAHDGWTALHVEALDPSLRAEAARSFHALGGRYGAEADAIWRFQGGDPKSARALLQEAYAVTGWLRLRNLALGASDIASMGGI